MKHIVSLMAVLAVFGAVMAHSQEVAAPVTVEMTGTVVVVKDDAGLIKSASLKTGAGEEAKLVAITLDAQGKALVLAAGEKSVKVSGVVAEVEGASTITVSKFEVVVEEVKAEAVEAPAAKE